ncbi:MAG: photosystem II assembly protein Psb34 [Elainellaceae cyanobacterium]
MPYTVEEGGRLNNFAAEPKVYQAEPPNSNQKRNYIILAAGAAVLIAGVLSIAVSVS